MALSPVFFIDVSMELYRLIVFLSTSNFFDRGVYKRKQTVQYHSQNTVQQNDQQDGFAPNRRKWKFMLPLAYLSFVKALILASDRPASTGYQLKMSWQVVQHCCEGAWCFYAEGEYAWISSPVG